MEDPSWRVVDSDLKENTIGKLVVQIGSLALTLKEKIPLNSFSIDILDLTVSQKHKINLICSNL